MKAIKQTIYDSVDEYEKVAKVGDIIVLGGCGIIDGIESLESKHDTVKVSNIKDDGSISFKEYRGRKSYSLFKHSYNQRVLLLTKKEFSELPILW